MNQNLNKPKFTSKNAVRVLMSLMGHGTTDILTHPKSRFLLILQICLVSECTIELNLLTGAKITLFNFKPAKSRHNEDFGHFSTISL